jgi:hypothetical protein
MSQSGRHEVLRLYFERDVEVAIPNGCTEREAARILDELVEERGATDADWVGAPTFERDVLDPEKTRYLHGWCSDGRFAWREGCGLPAIERRGWYPFEDDHRLKVVRPFFESLDRAFEHDGESIFVDPVVQPWLDAAATVRVWGTRKQSPAHRVVVLLDADDEVLALIMPYNYGTPAGNNIEVEVTP